jgi:hypothetical protein
MLQQNDVKVLKFVSGAFVVHSYNCVKFRRSLLNAFPGKSTAQTTPKQTESNIPLLARISLNRNK